MEIGIRGVKKLGQVSAKHAFRKKALPDLAHGRKKKIDTKILGGKENLGDLDCYSRKGEKSIHGRARDLATLELTNQLNKNSMQLFDKLAIQFIGLKTLSAFF